MSYSTYITDALVCGVKNSNTSDRSFLLFTKDAGMLFASARSVREERSKQRYALQEFAQVRVSLIKGKSGWRIGSVEALQNFYQRATDKEVRGSIVSVFRDLRRFIHGEEVSTSLHDLVTESLEFVLQPMSTERRKMIEKVIKVRLLHELGYVSKKSLPEEAFSAALSTILEADKELEKQLDKALKNAVTASHL